MWCDQAKWVWNRSNSSFIFLIHCFVCSQYYILYYKTCMSAEKHCFSYTAPQVWNNLPANIRDSKSLMSFKRAFKMLMHVSFVSPAFGYLGNTRALVVIVWGICAWQSSLIQGSSEFFVFMIFDVHGADAVRVQELIIVNNTTQYIVFDLAEFLLWILAA